MREIKSTSLKNDGLPQRPLRFEHRNRKTVSIRLKSNFSPLLRVFNKIYTRHPKKGWGALLLGLLRWLTRISFSSVLRLGPTALPVSKPSHQIFLNNKGICILPTKSIEITSWKSWSRLMAHCWFIHTRTKLFQILHSCFAWWWSNLIIFNISLFLLSNKLRKKILTAKCATIGVAVLGES